MEKKAFGAKVSLGDNLSKERSESVNSVLRSTYGLDSQEY